MKTSLSGSVEVVASFVRRRSLWSGIALALLGCLPLRAQGVAMQDKFTYTTSNLSGHAPTTGSGTWVTSYSTGNISTNGTQALMDVNSGTPGTGSAVGSYAFTPAANTIYTLTTVLNFTGPVGAGYNSWAASGFSSLTNGGNSSSNIAPWMLISAQTTATNNPGTNGFHGSTSNGSGTLAASNYSSPITETVSWNTATGLAQYSINGVLQSSWTYTTALPTGTFYAFFEGFKTGNFVNVDSVTLTAQTLNFAAMQDNFTYVTSNITGHAPTTAPGGLGTWQTNLTSGTISTDGTQAVMNLNSGTPGVGSVISSFGFLPSASTLYSLRVTFNYTGPVGSGYDCWAGLGFCSNPNANQSTGTNTPWMFIRPQGVSTDTPGASGDFGETVAGSTTLPAADYSAPITATITWNTSTGQARYYIDNFLQTTWTATAGVPNGSTYYAYFEGFKTGRYVNVSNITLTAQPLPTPQLWLAPQNPTNPDLGVPTDFMSLFQATSTWPLAESQTGVFEMHDNYFLAASSANVQTMVSYLTAHGIKLSVTVGPLQEQSTCGAGEGYSELANATTVANKIKNDGGTIDSVTLDEPLEFGYEGAPSYKCPGLSIQNCADETWATVQAYRAVFPSAKVIDIEPYEAFPTADVANWFADYQKDSGAPFDGALVDTNYAVSLPTNLAPMVTQFAQSGVPFGVIFDGVNETATSNAQWMLSAEENIQQFYAANLPGQPAIIDVSSWNPYPTTALPETNTGSLTYLLDYIPASPLLTEAPPVPFYRLYYTTNSSIFIYTSSASEQATLLTQGWTANYNDNGVYTVPSNAPGLVAIYRYKNTSGTHTLYALSLSSSDSTLAAAGYVLDSAEGYVFPASSNGSQGGVPFHSLSKVSGTTTYHFYTTDTTTYQNFITNGWTDNGVLCYMTPRWTS